MAASATWIKQLFSGTDKLFDILNVGRLIFYTAAGLLAVYPVWMVLNLISLEPSSAGWKVGFFSSFDKTVREFNPEIFFVALVAGFLIANVSFTAIVLEGFKRVRNKIGEIVPSEKSINFQYPYLNDKSGDDDDYYSWLIREYFRYVEISILVPVGFMLGLSVLGLYSIVYLIKSDLAQIDISDIFSAGMFLLVVVNSLGILKYYLWPVFWRPRVFDRTIETYLRAKINLIHGVEKFRRKAEVSARE